MCREHPERLARTAHQRRRLDRPYAGLELDRKRRRASEDGTLLDILDDHPLAPFEGRAAHARAPRNAVPKLEPPVGEAALGHHPELRAAQVEELDVAEVGSRDGNRGVYDRLEHRL